MTTKLTLSIDKKVIEKSKAYAASKKRSLSDLVEQYLLSLTSKAERKPIKAGGKIASLRGSFKAPADFDYKDVLQKEIRKKHG